jgi:hypothetical protein
MNAIILSFKDRVKEKPYYTDWDYDGGTNSINEEGKIDYDGLDDAYKMLLYIYAWNLSELCPYRSSVMKKFGWTAYKVGKLFKVLKAEGVIESVATFSERTGMISGQGYQIQWRVQHAIERQPKLAIAD